MLGHQRRQQRSGAISLPAASAQNGFQRFIRRFTAAPAGLIGQVRRKSMAVLSPQTAAAAAAAVAAASGHSAPGGQQGEVGGSQADLASFVMMKRPQPISLESLLRRTRFSSRELKAIYRRFKTECPYGLMHEEILEHILAQIFPLGNAHLFSHFVFCCFDVNRTGSVNFEQFALCLNVLLKGSLDERLRWIFNMYDINRDGEINRRELQELVGAIFELLGARVRPAVTPADVERHAGEAFRRLDTDGDGIISWDDFRAHFSQNPHLAAGMEALLTPII